MFLEFCVLLSLAAYLFYRWATVHNDFFKTRNIPHDKPFPLLGSMKDAVLRKESFYGIVKKLYNKHDGKVFGFFDQRQPILIVRDPDLLKQITIKDFDHFMNHRSIFGDSTRDTNLFASSLFFLRDSKWKEMRGTLSPAFTGSKMRQMFELINQVAKDSAAVLKSKEKTNGNGFELDLKDFCTRFTNDTIASTAFGLQVNSHETRDNEFYRMGKKVTTFNGWQNFKFFLYANFRRIMDFFDIEVFDKESTKYFMHLVLDAMKYRKEHNISRPDMINMLMETRDLTKSENTKASSYEWTDTEIVAQCFLFFFAGFETSATLMCFAAHEIMENPEIQEKLLHEIEGVMNDLNGEPLTYEALQGMKYLDMIISEALRKWPPSVAVDRMCTKDFVYTAPDGERIEVKKGEYIWIPIVGYHSDPKYFENPEKFDPERFSDENKDKIHPFAYMPFGLGPRSCIGSRFAQLEAKAVLFYLIRDFHLSAAKKTMRPIELTKSTFLMLPENGFWLKFASRA